MEDSRQAHPFPDPSHGIADDRLDLLMAHAQYLLGPPRLLLESGPSFAERVEVVGQAVSKVALALDTGQCPRAAPSLGLVEDVGRDALVDGEDRADLGPARIAQPYLLGIRHHPHRF